ncbi:MAG: peptidoglycan recognition family protein, partial [Planctomycetota bacterium]
MGLQVKLLGVSLALGIVVSIAGCIGAPARDANLTAIDRGYAALESGNIVRAREIFAAVAKQAPRSSARGTLAQGEAYLGLGRCELAAQNPAGAIVNLQRAEALLAGSPSQQSVELLLSDAFLRIEKWDQARRHLEGAFAYLAEGYQRRRCAYLLSLLYERAGHDRKARRYWEVAGGQELPEYAEWRQRILPPRPQIVAPPPRIVRPQPQPVVAKLKVIPRSAWKAKKTRGNVNRMEAPRKITVHHTGEESLPKFRTKQDVKDYLRTLQRSHQKHRGWADLGYHYLIDKWGNIWEGRPSRYQGAHAGSPTTNQRNIGIALIGNFEDHEPPRAQWNTLRRFVQDLRSRYRIPTSAVYSHRKL